MKSYTKKCIQVCPAQDKRKAVEFRQRVFGGWVLMSEMSRSEALDFAAAIVTMVRERDTTR